MQAWNDFVAAQPVSSEPAPARAINNLSHLGLIRVSGDDKRDFLQGQLTNDIRQLSPEHSQMSGYCSPKGRMLSNFRVFQRGDDFYLMLPRERLGATLKRLSMFVLRSKVILHDASDELVLLGLSGAMAAALPFAAPDTANATRSQDDVTLLTLPGDRPRVLLIAPPARALDATEKAIGTGGIFASRDFWTLMEIRAGLPSVYESTTEAFVPQMTNMQLIDGVSFKKGCYTGQEVVARMQYLGKLKRRMYRVHIAGDVRPLPGIELFSPQSASGQGAGRIVDAAPAPTGGFEALAVIEIACAEDGQVFLGAMDGPLLQILDLPYTWEAA